MNTEFHELGRLGFVYGLEYFSPSGERMWTERVHNLMPDEAIRYVLGTAFAGGSQIPTWYIQLYKGNYTPINSDNAATFPGFAVECTEYESLTRPQWVPGAISGGAIDNTDSLAEFEFTSAVTVYGGGMSGSPTKASTTSILGSAVRFSSPKVMDVGGLLRVTAGIALVSA